MNRNLRELEVVELDLVTGGNILSPISNAIAAGVKAGIQWVADNKPFPISYDAGPSTSAGQQLGEVLKDRGGGSPL
jgi:hypothetical protein